MAETLASATPLFERSPIVDVAVHEGEDDLKRGGRWPLRWSRLEQRVEIERRNDPLLRIYPAGRKNGSIRGIQSKDNRSIESVEVRKTQAACWQTVPRWFDQSNRESCIRVLVYLPFDHLGWYEGCWSHRWGIIPVGYRGFVLLFRFSFNNRNNIWIVKLNRYW